MPKQSAKKREELIIAAMSVIPIYPLTAGHIVDEASMYGLHARDGRSIVPDLKRLMSQDRVIKDSPGYWMLSETEAKKANRRWIDRGGPYTETDSDGRVTHHRGRRR
jgi:hypothetical protein